jgi:hypothetical protein
MENIDYKNLNNEEKKEKEEKERSIESMDNMNKTEINTQMIEPMDSLENNNEIKPVIQVIGQEEFKLKKTIKTKKYRKCKKGFHRFKKTHHCRKMNKTKKYRKCKKGTRRSKKTHHCRKNQK